MKRINVKARVLYIPKATLVFTRFGECARVTNALIADELEPSNFACGTKKSTPFQ
jgi:hypothetical protein